MNHNIRTRLHVSKRTYFNYQRIYTSINSTRKPLITRYASNVALSSSHSAPTAAFAFDIDGVLTQGSHVLPQARRVLQYLDGKNQWNKKFPFVLMTNGGGKPEQERCKELSEQLETKIETSMFVQSHTVLSSSVLPYLSLYRDRTVMVLGGVGDTCRRIAEGYGYKNVVIPADVLAWNPDLWPFHKLRQEEQSYIRRDLDFSSTPIEAIFVFHDPRNWALDVQIALDLVRYGSKSQPAFRRSNESPSRHVATSPPDAVELVFCNPDLIWRGAYPQPRLGQGAFREAFQGVYAALEGKQYPYKQLGKPTKETYHHAESLLLERARQLGRSTSERAHEIPRSHIYMIGDNPESDIAGANSAGWSSVLVHTGVYSPADGGPTHIPTFQAGDVEEAVYNALSRTVSRS